MAKCPNCGQETARTSDWVCEWCGYPLPEGMFRKLKKTFQEVRQARENGEPVEEKPAPKDTKKPVRQEKPLPKAGSKNQVKPMPAAQLQSQPPPPPQPEGTVQISIEALRKLMQPPAAPPPPPAAPPPPQAQPSPAAPIQSQPAAVEKTPQASVPPPPPVTVEKAPQASVPLSPPVVKPEVITPASPPHPAPPPVEVRPVAQPSPPPPPPPAVEVKPAPPLAPAPIQAPAQVVLPPPPPPQVKPELPPAVVMTVAELLTAYKNEGPAADARFANQTFRITGPVEKLNIKVAMDIYSVILNDPGKGLLPQGVRCIFDRKYASILSQLAPGQTVTIQGRYSGSIIDISLRDCILVS